MTESMSVRQRSRRLDLVWWGGGAFLAIGALFLSEYFLIPLLLLFAVVVVMSLVWIRCPTCRKSARLREVSMGSGKLMFPLGFTESRCSRCGIDLSGDVV
jgi:hypothetical protein